MTAPAARESDGRAARGRRTREAIIGAAVDLFEAGEVHATSRRIAAQAGISERTLFLHFADLESLRAAVTDQHLDSIARDRRTIDPGLPFEARARRFAAHRAQVLERMTPLRRAALVYESSSLALQRSRARWRVLARRELERTFAAELDGADDRPTTLAAAEMATSWAAWDDLRTMQRLSRRAATATLELALVRLLGDRAASR